MTIHTVRSLARERRRVENHLERAELVLRAMQHGCSLHLHYTTSGPQWVLSDGRKVSERVAQLVTTSASVVGCGDALFEGARSQSFRWWRDPA